MQPVPCHASKQIFSLTWRPSIYISPNCLYWIVIIFSFHPAPPSLDLPLIHICSSYYYCVCCFHIPMSSFVNSRFLPISIWWLGRSGLEPWVSIFSLGSPTNWVPQPHIRLDPYPDDGSKPSEIQKFEDEIPINPSLFLAKPSWFPRDFLNMSGGGSCGEQPSFFKEVAKCFRGEDGGCGGCSGCIPNRLVGSILYLPWFT